MPIAAGDVGRRVVIRSRLPGETGPSGGPALTDVIGTLQAYDHATARVRRRDGTVVSVPVADIVAANRLPEPTGLRTDPDTLERICSAGWPAVVTAPLGDWMLRAAGGFTGRANSCLVAGDPGRPFEKACSRITAFYDTHHLPARAQVVVGSPWEDRFASAGWHSVRGPHGGALVMAASLRAALTVAGPSGDVALEAVADERWMRLYNRAASHDPQLARRVLEGPAEVVFARVGDPPVAIGRMTVTGQWAGIAAVEVDPSHRRRGLARAVVDELVRWAVARGARWCYLQVTADNEPALELWRRYGFREHHRYTYLTLR